MKKSSNKRKNKDKKSQIKLIIGATILVIAIVGVIVLFKNANGNSRIIREKGATHKGIVYLDPTDLDKTCTKNDVKKNVNENGTPTGISSGCMKFYIYDDSNDTYKMILDHNIISELSSLPDSIETIMEKYTSNWEVKPRLISADEIAHIVGADSSDTLNWDSSMVDAPYFRLDGSGTSEDEWLEITTDEEHKSKYAWLYDYTGLCADYGCNFEDPNTYRVEGSVYDKEAISGYWTSTSVDNYTWALEWELLCLRRNDYGYGIRPVIEIKKSILDK